VFAEDVFHYNLARLFFDKKEYNKAVMQLNLVSFNEKFLALDTRVLLAQAYYELDETDVLYSLLDSFYAYLRRKKNIAYHQVHYLNFVSLLKKMIRLLPQEKKKKEQLLELTNRQKMVEKKWLLNKLQTLR
jgi:outer membrane protein assembly factor BamD (BamD/ComL family)